MPCDPGFLANITMFELLDEDDRVALANVVDEVKVPAGQTLFQAGDPGDSLFIVRDGKIELFIKDTAGQKIVLHTAQSGDMFGELAMLDSGARSATALALTDAELLVLDRDDLVLLFQRKPESALHMLASLTSLTRKRTSCCARASHATSTKRWKCTRQLCRKLPIGLPGSAGAWPF